MNKEYETLAVRKGFKLRVARIAKGNEKIVDTMERILRVAENQAEALQDL